MLKLIKKIIAFLMVLLVPASADGAYIGTSILNSEEIYDFHFVDQGINVDQAQAGDNTDYGAFVRSFEHEYLTGGIYENGEIQIGGLPIIGYIHFNEPVYMQVDDVIVPDEIEGYPVTRIQQYAFFGTNIKTIVIGDNVRAIGNSAFECDDLTAVTVGTGVQYIGDSGINFPGSTLIFKEPSSLKCLTYCAIGAPNLDVLKLPNFLERIETYSLLATCNKLIIPASVQIIEKNALLFNHELIILSRNAVLENNFMDGCNTLYCYENSTAHDYAVEKGINFVLIDESSLTPAAGASASVGASGLIRGVPLGLSAAEIGSLLSVDGSATIQITDNSGNIGTGTRIDLINSTYGNVESSYYLVFSGDVDGDGVVDDSDFLNARGVLAGNTEFENPAQFVAADLNGDGYFSICDYTLLKSVLAGSNTLNSATGELTPAL